MICDSVYIYSVCHGCVLCYAGVQYFALKHTGGCNFKLHLAPVLSVINMSTWGDLFLFSYL